MGKPGLLKFEQFGMSMPATDPYIPVPPVWARNVEQFVIHFKTDYESAARWIPEPLEFDKDEPTAMVVCNKIGFVTYATEFLEAQLAFDVAYKGKPYVYISNLFVNSEDALVAGREVYGYAKKMAHMEYFCDEGYYTMMTERPRGTKIFTALVKIKKPLDPGILEAKDTLNLKIIPSPVSGEGPQVCQLVGVPITGSIQTCCDGLPNLWECTGSLSWGSASLEDPWHRVPINEVTFISFQHSHSILQPGYILYDYLKQGK